MLLFIFGKSIWAFVHFGHLCIWGFRGFGVFGFGVFNLGEGSGVRGRRVKGWSLFFSGREERGGFFFHVLFS